MRVRPAGTVASGAVEGGVVLLDYAPPAARHDVAVMLTRGLWQGVGMAQLAVLLVDDEDGIRQLLTRQLGENRCLRVCGAVGTGEAALAVAAVERPDVVVLDWHVPGMDPVALMAQLRALLPGLRIVVFSSDVTAASTAVRAGAESFVAKGRDIAELIRHVLKQ